MTPRTIRPFGCTASSQPIGRFLITLVAVAAWLLPRVADAQAIQGVCGPAADFQIDADLECATEPYATNPPTLEAPWDWYHTIGQSCSGVLTPTPAGACANFTDGITSFLRDPHWAGSASDPTVFSGMSNKNNDDIGGTAPWEWAPKSGDPGKDDLTETYVTSRDFPNPCVPGQFDRWLIVGIARRTTNGTSYVDIEFNRLGLEVTGTPAAGGQILGHGPILGRSLGDFLISVDFVGGGSHPIVAARALTASGYSENATLPFNDPNCPDREFVHACINDAVTPNPCGATSKNGSIASAYEADQFAEIAINLTGIGLPDSALCGVNSTLTIKTRSSAQITAELKDHVIHYVSLIQPPVADAGPDQAKCADAGVPTPFSLNGSCTTGPCAWTQVSGPTVEFGDPASCVSTATFSGPGTAVVRLTCGNIPGCTDDDDVSLTIHANPIADAGPDQAQCADAGASVVFPLNGTCSSGDCQWTGPPGIVFGDPTLCVTTATFTGPGSVEVRLTCTTSTTPACTDNDTANLTIHANPTASAGDDQAQCADAGASVVFPLNGTCSSGDCEWTGPPGVVFGDPTSCVTTATFTGPGSVEVRLTCTTSTTPACTDSDTATLTIHANPTASAPADQAQCADAGVPVEFALNGDCTSGSCKWTGPPGVIFGDPNSCVTTATFSGPGTVEVMLTCTTSTTPACTDNDTARLTIYGNPTADAGVDQAQCADAGVPVEFTLNGNCTSGSCQWTGPLGVTFADPNSCVTTATFSGPGTVEVMLTCTTGTTPACTDNDTSRLTIYANPTASAGADQAQCADAGVPVEFALNGSCTSGDCEWTGPPGVVFGDPNSCVTTATFSGPETVEVQLTCTTSDGCTDNDTANLTIHANPTADAGDDQAQCGDAGVPVEFTLNGNCTSGDCEWTGPPAVVFGDPTSCVTTATFSGPGTVEVQLTCTTGTTPACTDSDPANLTIHGNPVCTLAAPAVLPQCGSSGNTLVGPAGFVSYHWELTSSDPGWTITAGQDMQTVTYSVGTFGSMGHFTLTVTDEFGCEGTCTVDFDCTPPDEGCTPGFWKNHTTLWDQPTDAAAACIAAVAYSGDGTTSASYRDIFGLTSLQMTAAGYLDPDMSMETAINLGGGGFEKLARHAVAALLSACALNGYAYDPLEVLTMVHDATIAGTPEPTAQQLADANDIPNCPLGAAVVATAASKTGRSGADPSIESMGAQTEGARELALYRPTPNPFASSQVTRIAYAVGQEQRVDVAVFDVAGRRVRGVVGGVQTPGRYETSWDGKNDQGVEVAKGIYFLRVTVGDKKVVSRVVFLR